MSAGTVTEAETDTDVVIEMGESKSTDTGEMGESDSPKPFLVSAVRPFFWCRPIECWRWLPYPEILEQCMGEEPTAREICSKTVWRLAKRPNHKVFVKEYFVLVHVSSSWEYMEYRRQLEGRSDWFIPAWGLPVACTPSIRTHYVSCEIIR